MASKKMLEEWSWAVVGSHGKNPICDKLYNKLLAGNKKVFRVNPGVKADGLYSSLTEVGQPIDVVDLVINPAKGVAVVEEMHKLGVKQLWIQPGAASKEILDLAQQYNMLVFQGCVLVEAKF